MLKGTEHIFLSNFPKYSRYHNLEPQTATEISGNQINELKNLVTTEL